jgi:uncharacterized membrane protein YhaH (DUF805 family)
MNFLQSGQCFFTKMFDLKTRIPRSEFWWGYLIGNVLFWFIVFPILSAATIHLSNTNAFTFWGFVFAFPMISLQVRRLHDMNRRGWWIFLNFIPIIGSLIFLVWMCQRGDTGPNYFGEDPLPPDPRFPKPLVYEAKNF